MRGVFRAPTPPPSEAEVRARAAEPPKPLVDRLEAIAFPASREDLVNALTGYALVVGGAVVRGEVVARALRERVYRSREQLLAEAAG